MVLMSVGVSFCNLRTGFICKYRTLNIIFFPRRKDGCNEVPDCLLIGIVLQNILPYAVTGIQYVVI